MLKCIATSDKDKSRIQQKTSEIGQKWQYFKQ